LYLSPALTRVCLATNGINNTPATWHEY
jgi:hypothetical protein